MSNQTHDYWQGKLVRLRAIEQEDIDSLTSPISDSWLDRADDRIYFPSSLEKARESLNAQRDRKDDSFFWIIETVQGEKVGNIATFDCDARVGAFKYSIIIDRPFWRRGYASEAIKIVMRYYFHELRYQKCTVLVYSFNQASIELHSKLGFTTEGTLRRMVFTNGEFYDELYFGMTSEEFDELDPKSKNLLPN